MADNHYDSGEGEAKDKPDTAEKEDSSDENTALLPKSFFKNKDDLKAGAKEKIEILHLYDDEVEVRCIYDKKDSKDEDSYKNDDRSEPMREIESNMDRMVATAE